MCRNLNHSNNCLWTSRVVNFDSSLKLLIEILNYFKLSSISLWFSLINSVSHLLDMLFKDVVSFIFHRFNEFFNFLFVLFSDFIMNDFDLKMKSLLEFPQCSVGQISFLKFNFVFVVLKLFIQKCLNLILKFIKNRLLALILIMAFIISLPFFKLSNCVFVYQYSVNLFE